MEVNDINNSGQLLTFRLDGEIFAVDVVNVREVVEFELCTKIPRTNDFLRGVINLRGNVISVIDLKLKFGMEITEKTIDTRIIVLDVLFEGEKIDLGVIADQVQEVITIPSEMISPPSTIGLKNISLDFIKGIGRYTDQFILILDINKVFSEEELNFSISEK